MSKMTDDQIGDMKEVVNSIDTLIENLECAKKAYNTQDENSEAMKLINALIGKCKEDRQQFKAEIEKQEKIPFDKILKNRT